MQIDSLETLGFICVPYPASLRRRVHSAMVSWKNFCSLSLKEKKKLSGGDRLRDFGYMLREDEGERADRKEQFHVSLANLLALRSKVSKISNLHATAFISAVGELLHETTPLVKEFAKEVERRWRLYGFESEVMDSQNHWTFRYLHYFSGGEGGTLAHAHADRGGFTIHLDESHPGGEYLGFSGRWKPLSLSRGQTVIFPSMGLQYRSKCVLKALCHRVVARPETLQEGRYSMVAFIDFALGHRYNDAAKRLQDFKPGFNYRMPMEEFQKLFVPC